jgi:DNA-binding NarL/FixJ family response regulator
MAQDHIGVYLLAGNRLLREALAKLLQKRGDICLLGSTGLSSQIVEQIAAVGPDVLLCDLPIDALAKLPITREIRKAVPGIKIVMIGMDEDEQVFLCAVLDGVVGYLLKEASASEIADAVRAVANDNAVCPPSLCRTLFTYVSSSETSQAPRLPIRHDLGLTRRELQLVQMIAQGLTNKEIAARLNLSENTIKNHVHRMLRKLGARDRLGMVEACLGQHPGSESERTRRPLLLI